MSSASAIARLPNITIQKIGNNSGFFHVSHLEGCNGIRIELDGSLPFAASNLHLAPTPDTGAPDTARQYLFESCVHFLRLSNGGSVAPYRFIDGADHSWRMDKSAAFWLLETKRWVEHSTHSSSDFGLRYIGTIANP